jgi:hypothetical protein
MPAITPGASPPLASVGRAPPHCQPGRPDSCRSLHWPGRSPHFPFFAWRLRQSLPQPGYPDLLFGAPACTWRWASEPGSCLRRLLLVPRQKICRHHAIYKPIQNRLARKKRTRSAAAVDGRMRKALVITVTAPGCQIAPGVTETAVRSWLVFPGAS